MANTKPKGPFEKLAKAARLQAEAARLFQEAAEELAQGAPPDPPPRPITEIDRARARRALKRLGLPPRGSK